MAPAAVVATILLYIVIMFIEGQVLVPKIEGGAFSFHPALVLFLVVAGVTLFGILGAILALPAAAMAQAIVSEVGTRHAVVDSHLTMVVEGRRRRRLGGHLGAVLRLLEHGQLGRRQPHPDGDRP